MRRERYHYLDGLRGIGAVMVAAVHMLSQFTPMKPPYAAAAALYDGQLAVFVFFLISGFVLASVYDRSDAPAIGLMAGRVARLYIPAVASGLLCFVVWLILQPIAPVNLGLIPNSAHGLESLWDFLPDTLLITPFLGHGASSLFLWLPYLGQVIHDQYNTNPALWTISVELIGSFIVLALARAKMKIPAIAFLVLLALASAFFIRSLLMPFVIGLALFYFRPAFTLPGKNMLAIAMIALGVYVSLEAVNENYFGWSVAVARIDYAYPAQSAASVQRAGAALLIFVAVLISPALQWLLSTKPFQILGRASFAIYLAHWPLIVFLGVGREFYSSSLPVWLCNSINVAFYLIVLFFVTLIFMRIDRASIDLSHFISRRFKRTREAEAERISVAT